VWRGEDEVFARRLQLLQMLHVTKAKWNRGAPEEKIALQGNEGKPGGHIVRVCLGCIPSPSPVVFEMDPGIETCKGVSE
jgi:hypothetical protein